MPASKSYVLGGFKIPVTITLTVSIVPKVSPPVKLATIVSSEAFDVSVNEVARAYLVLPSVTVTVRAEVSYMAKLDTEVAPFAEYLVRSLGRTSSM